MYYHIPNFMNLEHMINEVNKHGSLKIVPPLFNEIKTINDLEISALCHENFFPSLPHRDFSIFNINHITDNHPFYFRASKIAILNSMNHAKNIVDIAIKELNSFTKNTEHYLKEILRTTRTDIAKEFSSQLHSRLKIIRSNLNNDNLNLVSINRKPLPGQGVNSYFFYAGLNDQLRKEGVFAFTLTDNTKKVYISIDKLYFVDPVHPDVSLRNYPAVDITDILIHETTHINRVATDIFYLQRDNQGQMNPILDEVDQFLGTIKKSDTQANNKILILNKEYIESVKVYDHWKDRLLTDDDTLSYFSSHDTGILANYYLHNADFITKITRDIYQNTFVGRSPLGWLENLTRKLNLG